MERKTIMGGNGDLTGSFSLNFVATKIIREKLYFWDERAPRTQHTCPLASLV